MPPTCTTTEVNLLVYHYLKESGFHHACFSLRHEGRLDEDPLSREAVIEPGRLLRVLQKGLLYMAVEAHVNSDGSEKACSAPFSLVGPPHACDGNARRRASPEPVPRPLTPEPPKQKPATSVEAAAQTDTMAESRRANGKHTASAVASSSKQRLDAEDEAPAEGASKRKASANISGPTSPRDEKRPKTDSAATKKLPNGTHHGDADEDDEVGPSGVTAAAAAPTKNGKNAHASAAKSSKASDASKAGKKGKKKKKKSSAADKGDDEGREDSEGPSSRPPADKKKGANAARPPVQLTGKARGKEVPIEDVTTLKGHTAEVYVSAWNPTVPRMIASAAADATVRIWDLPEKGQSPEIPAVCKHLPTIHTKDVSTLEWNPDGTLLASGSYDGILRLWTPQGDLHLVMSRHQGPIFTVRWNRKGTALLTSGADGTAITWDTSSGRVRSVFPIHSDSVLAAEWLVSSKSQGPSSTRNDLIFATCSSDNSINLCRDGESKPIRTLRGHDDEINTIQFDPSQTMLASGSDDHTLRIWNIDAELLSASGNEPSGRAAKRGSAPLSKGRGSSAALDASSMDVDESDDDADASDLRGGGVAAGGDKSNSGRPICRYKLTGHTNAIFHAEWAPTGPGSPNPHLPRMVATASFDHTARLWNAEDGTCMRTLDMHTNDVHTLCWSPDATFIATGAVDSRVFVHRVGDGAVVKAFAATGPVYHIAWHVIDDVAAPEGGAATATKVKEEEGADAGSAEGPEGAAKAAAPNGSSPQRKVARHQLSVSQADKLLSVLDLGSLEDWLPGGSKGELFESDSAAVATATQGQAGTAPVDAVGTVADAEASSRGDAGASTS